jgi:hypothetical protein
MAPGSGVIVIAANPTRIMLVSLPLPRSLRSAAFILTPARPIPMMLAFRPIGPIRNILIARCAAHARPIRFCARPVQLPPALAAVVVLMIDREPCALCHRANPADAM